MPELPSISALTGAATTEAQAKQWFGELRSYLAGLLGVEGTPAAARAALGLVNTLGTTVVSANTSLSVADHFARVLRCTAGLTLTLPLAAAAGDGWWCDVQMAGMAAVTLARSGGSLITVAGGTQGGQASLSFPSTSPGNPLWACRTVRLQCDGTHWHILATEVSRGFQRYIASGSWICPQGVLAILVNGAGGGAGGTAGSEGFDGNGNYTYRDGLAGGAGGRAHQRLVSVTPGTTYSVIVGGGGAPGANGSPTSLGALISLPGGTAGGGSGASDPVYPALAGTSSGAGGRGGSISFGNFGGAGSPGFLEVSW